ncbi:MAG: cyclic nucleotide-binding domain-containing protein [Bacteriovoracaceae bacterium]|nr:cyclic nucleotide-binding domain-containing protein [Bacteriovoracaceae bacterium]
MMMPLKLRAGETLIHEGEKSDCMYILKSGELVVSKFKDGKPTQLGYIQAGETVGEMSFLDNLNRSATVKAHTDCEVLMINRPHFDEEVRSSSVFIQTLLKALSGRLRKADAKLNT